jgi:hypothetical protein
MNEFSYIFDHIKITEGSQYGPTKVRAQFVVIKEGGPRVTFRVEFEPEDINGPDFSNRMKTRAIEIAESYSHYLPS